MEMKKAGTAGLEWSRSRIRSDGRTIPSGGFGRERRYFSTRFSEEAPEVSMVPSVGLPP